MSLTPTDNWLRAAHSGTAEPILKFEFEPTVAYDEKRGSYDWDLVQNGTNLDTGHHSDELRLERTRELVHPERQLRGEVNFFPMHDLKYEEEGKILHDGATLGHYVQIFRSERSFKLKYLRLMTDNHEKFTGQLTVKIVADLDRGIPGLSTNYETRRADRILENTRELGKLVVDYSSAREIITDTRPDGKWVVYDFSDQNVWIPGGDVPCAIVVEPSGNYQRYYLWFGGSKSRSAYDKGCLYWGIPSGNYHRLQDGQLAFEFTIDSFAATGSGEWQIDLGRNLPVGCMGELELRYCEPDGTSASFELAESDYQISSSPYIKYNRVSDGSRITKRYARVRVTLNSDDLGIDTPRVISIRAAFKQKIDWLLASRPKFGHPNLVAEAPDYSAEGDPLSGSGTSTDTSRIVLLDAGGIVSGMFSGNYMKNDRVKIWLGFDTPYFLDSDSKSAGDWLPFKTVWIEDWEPAEGSITVHCYDQQIRFRQAQAPRLDNPASQTEQVSYDRANPVSIKYDMLRRAGIRPSEIDFIPSAGKLAAVDSDNGSFASMAAAHDWQFNFQLRSSTSLEGVDSELNRHLLAFQLVDENGRWVVRYADFKSVQNSENGWTRNAVVLPTVESEHVSTGSEIYSPGLKYLRNWGVVYFGGEGGDETGYASLVISPGNQSTKAFKESNSDKLLSAFIPADKEDQARQVALNRRLLQHQGLRTVEFTTGLRYANLQIGDHINFNSKYYRRPGADSPNPLLVLITRKNIDQNLSSINWSGVVLLDAEQQAIEEYEINAPPSLEVEPQSDGTVVWQWPASLGEMTSGIIRYELFQRLSHLKAWGAPIASVKATRLAYYSWSAGEYDYQLQYDFGVRAVHSSGVTSSITVQENVVLTGPQPSPLASSEWSYRNEPGEVIFTVADPADDVAFYNLYQLGTGGWLPLGSFLPGREYTCHLPDPFSRQVLIFALRAANKWGESEISPVKVVITKAIKPADLVPGVPVMDGESGLYPLVSRIPVGTYQSFTLTLKLRAPELYPDYVGSYKVMRRFMKNAEGQQWSEWNGLPELVVKAEDEQTPSPRVMYYTNTDHDLIPDFRYQYKAQAVSIWGTPGEFCNAIELLMTDDTTGPDKPLIASVSSETGRVRLVIQAATIDGGPCPDFSHFIIEGNREGTGWETLEERCTGTTWYHTGPDSDLGIGWQYRVYAIDYSGNVSPASDPSSLASKQKTSMTALASDVTGDGTPGTLSQITANSQEIDLRVETSKVINAINLSGEGIRIDASKLSINGYTEFASGYNPTGKLDSVGGQYNSSSGGARVRIFPTSDIGIQVTDGVNDVFKTMVGGDDVGDVIIGSAAKYLKWDKSASALQMQVGDASQKIVIGQDSGAGVIDLFNSSITTFWGAVTLRSGAQSPATEPSVDVFSMKSSEVSRRTTANGGMITLSRYDHSISTITNCGWVSCPVSGDWDMTIGALNKLILTAPLGDNLVQVYNSDFDISSGALMINGTVVLTGQVSSVSKPSADLTSLKSAVDAIIDNMKAKHLMV